jgi:GTP pyrophosphokinase
VQGRGPSRDWLNLVKTSEARSKIRTWFKNECREENIEQGKAAFERELSRNLIHLTEEKMQELLEIQCRKQHFSSVEDFYAAIGYGGVLLSRIMPRVKDDYVRITKDVEPVTPENMVSAKKHHSTGGVVIEGMDNCLVKFARCCNPVPGDDIIGFITRGFGVSIHTRDCVNVPKHPENSPEAGRWVRVSWDTDSNQVFKATILVEAQNRVGLLADLTAQLASMRVMIYAVNVREPRGDAATIHLTVGVNGVEHLGSLVERLNKVSGIYSIHRGSFS